MDGGFSSRFGSVHSSSSLRGLKPGNTHHIYKLRQIDVQNRVEGFGWKISNT